MHGRFSKFDLPRKNTGRHSLGRKYHQFGFLLIPSPQFRVPDFEFEVIFFAGTSELGTFASFAFFFWLKIIFSNLFQNLSLSILIGSRRSILLLFVLIVII